MSIRAIAGLVALNGAYALLGTSLLWAFRGFARWPDVLRLTGLGYLVGVAAFGATWTQLLVLDIPFGGLGIVLTLVGGTVAAWAAGVRLGRTRPRGFDVAGPSSPAALVVTATGVALVGLLLEAFFRSARLQSLQAFDAWAFWVPKAKAIYFFGGLDEQVFTTTANPSYPPIVPILDAASFHAMGAADTVTFHLQFWFLVVGGVAAIAGSLHRHAPAWALWPSLLLILVVPRFGERLLTPQADVLVDLLFVVATLQLALWLRDARGWRLAVAAVLLAGATLTKREGLLFAGLGLAVAFAVTWSKRRVAWLPLGAVAAAVVIAAIPWRVWYRSHGISGEAPPNLGAGESLDRALDSLRLSWDVLVDTGLWSVLPFVLVIAVAAAFAWGDRRMAAFFSALTILLFLGGAWATYSYVSLPISADEALNPIVRYTGAMALLAGAAMPLLVASAWSGAQRDSP